MKVSELINRLEQLHPDQSIVGAGDIVGEGEDSLVVVMCAGLAWLVEEGDLDEMRHFYGEVTKIKPGVDAFTIVRLTREDCEGDYSDVEMRDIAEIMGSYIVEGGAYWEHLADAKDQVLYQKKKENKS